MNRIDYCDTCINDLGYRAGMHWPPYRNTCSIGIQPTKITEGAKRLIKYNCKGFINKHATPKATGDI